MIGAGLFSKAIGYFEYYTFAKGVGGDVAETGDGPGSFRVAGNVWHLTYGMSQLLHTSLADVTGNPETGSPTTNGGWQIFNAILGWSEFYNLAFASMLTFRQLGFHRYDPRICLLLAIPYRRSSLPQMARG